jgi:hypothetical protein
MFDPGEFDQLVEFQYESAADDEIYGGKGEITWLPLLTTDGQRGFTKLGMDGFGATDLNRDVQDAVAVPVWVKFEDVPPSRSESVRQGLQSARNQSRVVTHFNADIYASGSKLRVIRKGPPDITYEVVGGPAILGRLEYLELMVERYSSNG